MRDPVEMAQTPHRPSSDLAAGAARVDLGLEATTERLRAYETDVRAHLASPDRDLQSLFAASTDQCR